MKQKILYTSAEVIEILPDDGELPHYVSENIRCMIDTPSAARIRLADEGVDVSMLSNYLGLPDWEQPQQITFPLLSGAVAAYDGMEDLYRIHTMRVHFLVMKESQEPYRVTLTADGKPVEALGGISECTWLVSRIRAGEPFFDVMADMVALRDSQGRF
jgi:hypothetical protein